MLAYCLDEVSLKSHSNSGWMIWTWVLWAWTSSACPQWVPATWVCQPPPHTTPFPLQVRCLEPPRLSASSIKSNLDIPLIYITDKHKYLWDFEFLPNSQIPAFSICLIASLFIFSSKFSVLFAYRHACSHPQFGSLPGLPSLGPLADAPHGSAERQRSDVRSAGEELLIASTSIPPPGEQLFPAHLAW